MIVRIIILQFVERKALQLTWNFKKNSWKYNTTIFGVNTKSKISGADMLNLNVQLSGDKRRDDNNDNVLHYGEVASASVVSG